MKARRLFRSDPTLARRLWVSCGSTIRSVRWHHTGLVGAPGHHRDGEGMSIVADMWIGGTATAGAGSPIAVANPATGETIDEVTAAADEEVDTAVGAAAEAFVAWRRTDTVERAGHLRRLHDLAEEHADEVGALLNREQGKPTLEAQGELRHFLAGL